MRVSVIMPVYNAEKYLREAIESVLNQTFTDFEFLIFNDGSTDNSLAIINSFKDDRIKFHNSITNVGYLIHLNEGLRIAQGDYIARMDADDISYPERFDKQVAFLDNNPEIGVCGSWALLFSGESDTPYRTVLWKKEPCHNDIIRQALFRNPLIHPSVMFRNEDVKMFHLSYRDEYYLAEDYKFWIDFSKHKKLANIPEALIKYRDHDNNVSKNKKQALIASKIKAEHFLDYFNVDICCYDIQVLSKFMHQIELSRHELKQIDFIIRKIIKSSETDVFAKNIIRTYSERYILSNPKLFVLDMKIIQLLPKHKILMYILRLIKTRIKSLLKIG